ncbi:hypothetical protein WJX79_002109 [Trebouxia sp. C0005]
MKVLALISGGKDSCYNSMLCCHHGHEIIALGNLFPALDGTDELDSYMYQTVGHQVVAAYAACASLPLFRRRLIGSTKQQALVYDTTEGDEVEDLLALLSYARQQLPQLEAVSCGAIASDYQRLRVEQVCARLGLISLAYMWHQPQASLMSDMVEAGVHAVLCKVAAMGLKPQQHLGKTLAAMQPFLHSLRRLYECNVCGEGGEYESLVLDCPMFKHARIVLDKWDIVLQSPDSFAPKLTAVPQDAAHLAAHSVTSQAAVDELLASSTVIEVPADMVLSPNSLSDNHHADGQLRAADWQTHVQLQQGVDYVRAVCCPQQLIVSPPSGEATAEALHAALLAVSQELAALSLKLDVVLFVHLYLADMSHFAAANGAYRRHFPAVSPAARACVEVQLLPGCPVMLEVLLPSTVEGAQGRRVLHVQSISRWAPCCIGPYSQATSLGSLLHVAGQIGLDPATMQLLSAGLRHQLIRCLKSCQDVAVACQSDLSNGMLACTIYLAQQPTGHWQPLVLAVGVPALPKGALVEVQPMACTVDALTAQQAADTSSDEEVDSQQGGNHLSSWASRLVNRVGSIEGDSAGRWSSLTSQGVYCCCQVELVVCKDSLDTVMGHVVHMLSSLLAGASLTAQNVVSLTAYAQEAADRAFLTVTLIPLLGLLVAIILRFRPAAAENLDGDQVFDDPATGVYFESPDGTIPERDRKGELAFRPVSFTPWPVEAGTPGERLRIDIGPASKTSPRTFIFDRRIVDSDILKVTLPRPMGLVFEEDKAKGQVVVADFVEGSEAEKRNKVAKLNQSWRSVAQVGDVLRACTCTNLVYATRSLLGVKAPVRTIVVYGADNQKWPKVLAALKAGSRSDGEVTLVFERQRS